MENRKIAVIMSTYNGEKYVHDQIISILNQKNVELKLIIRDDGSTDNTVSVINDIKKNDDRIILYTGENIGWRKSFLRALKLAPEAEYYSFADQDDYWYSDKLSDAIDCLNSLNHMDIPVLYITNGWVADENLNRIKLLSSHINIDKVRKKSPYSYWYRTEMPGGCAQVFNESTRKLMLMIDDYPFGHDNLAERICGLMGKIIYDERPHFEYRQHNNNTIGYIEKKPLFAKAAEIIKSKYNEENTLAIELFLNTYGQNLTNKTKKFLMASKTSHSSIKSRIYLLTLKELSMSTLSATFRFKVKIALGKY